MVAHIDSQQQLVHTPGEQKTERIPYKFNPHSSIQTLPLFRHVSEDGWRRFQQLATVRTYDRENILFYQGNRPLGLYFICSGRVKLVKEDHFGRSQIMRIVQSPDILGDRAFFAERSYACTGEVMEEAQIYFLETSHFRDLFGQNAEMFRLLAQRFSQELGHAEECMHCLVVCSVRSRLATHLVGLKKRTNPPLRKNEFALTETRTELAQILGATPEGISRALAEFCSKGWIAVEGRHVRILKENCLRQGACAHARMSGQGHENSLDKNQITS